MATQTKYSHPTSNGNEYREDVPLEKDFSNGHLGADVRADDALRRIRTAGSISISPELFEKLYLSPQNQVHGSLRTTFGNPTPLALIGFLLSLTPLSCILMGWRGAGGSLAPGASGTATYMFFGGMLMVIGGVGEWILGNTFPFVVFTSFGAFWLGFAGTIQPFYNAYGAYSTTGNASDGLATPGFNASFGFFMLAMAFLCFIYLILALRTNIAFVIIFFTLVVAFCLLTAAYWHISAGNAALAAKLIKAAGAFTFVTCASGWWILFAVMLTVLDFPFDIPVGDLSTLIKPKSQKQKDHEV